MMHSRVDFIGIQRPCLLPTLTASHSSVYRHGNLTIIRRSPVGICSGSRGVQRGLHGRSRPPRQSTHAVTVIGQSVWVSHQSVRVRHQSASVSPVSLSYLSVWVSNVSLSQPTWVINLSVSVNPVLISRASVILDRLELSV